ncbi:MAG TPA: hypothetical protein VLC93_19960 [Myxococcota bacterium]|nr:hypothetical protein [Myxococcota bacterium]
MNRLLAFALITLAAGSAGAQSRQDRAYIAQTLLGGTTRSASTELALGTPPLRLTDQFLVGASIYARRTWLEGADPGDGGTFVGNDLQVGLLLLVPLNERWTLSLVPVAAGRFTSDADFRVPRDLTIAGVALASYAVSGNRDFVVSFGLLFTNTLPFSPVIPIAGLRWSNEYWRVEALWPQPQAVRRVGERFEVGVALRFDYPLYRIIDVAVADGTAAYARLTNHYFGGIIAARLVSDLWLAAKPAVNLGRVVRLADDDRDNLDGGRQSLDAAPAITFILSWRGGRR